MPDAFHALEETVTRDVTRALAEDVGTGDLTAALIPADRTSHARLMTRQNGVLCGVEWFRRTFEGLDPDVEIFWHPDDGDDIVANSPLCELEGRPRAILTGQRTALNFVQLLSAVATRTRQFARAIGGPRARGRPGHRGHRRAPFLRGLPPEGRDGAPPLHPLPPSRKKVP